MHCFRCPAKEASPFDECNSTETVNTKSELLLFIFNCSDSGSTSMQCWRWPGSYSTSRRMGLNDKCRNLRLRRTSKHLLSEKSEPLKNTKRLAQFRAHENPIPASTVNRWKSYWLTIATLLRNPSMNSFHFSDNHRQRGENNSSTTTKITFLTLTISGQLGIDKKSREKKLHSSHKPQNRDNTSQKIKYITMKVGTFTILAATLPALASSFVVQPQRR